MNRMLFTATAALTGAIALGVTGSRHGSSRSHRGGGRSRGHGEEVDAPSHAVG